MAAVLSSILGLSILGFCLMSYKSITSLRQIVGFGCHQPVQRGILWKFIDKRYDCAAHLNQPVAGLGVCDIGKLGIGDIQQSCQLHAVCGCLVEHQQKFGVGQHRARGSRPQTVLDVLRDGITNGTSATAFSPNATCSRGQIVTFLWRSQKSPAADTVNPFTDVAADSYYANAVVWAAENGITGGTSATTFSPSNNCTRAQIVTFLFRCLGE